MNRFRAQVALATAVLVVSACVCPGQSARPGYGAIPYADAGGTGVTFRAWAPYASTVQVRGDFNGWSAGTSLTNDGAGVWSADIAGAAAGQEYKYVLNGSLWRKDPHSRRISGNNSVIYDPGAFDWGGQSFTNPSKDDLVVYELHVGSFYDPVPGDWYVATLEDAIEKLDYLADLGVSAVELMPVAGFPGDRSWGYNPIDLFAVEPSYGGPDQLKAFVKACHERGIAVHLDIVHNHYDAQNPDCSLWEFDGWNGGPNYGGIYFYQEDTKCCTMWGRRPHYGRAGVTNFIRRNLAMWLDEYQVDGFRWDSPLNIKYYDGWSWYNADGYDLVSSINQAIRDNYTNRFSIGEDQGLNMNFDSEWYDSFHYNIVDQLTKASDGDRNMYTVSDQVGYGWGHYRVIYTESHDKVGKLNNEKRLVAKIDPSNPTSYWARKRAALGAVLTLTSPGIPMLFMGQEWFEDEPFDDYDPLDWAKADAHLRGRLLFKHLIRLRRDLDGGSLGLKGSGVNVHHVNDGAKVIAFHRWYSGGTNDDVVVAANFSVNYWSSYDIAFPYAGTWYTHFNSDWRLYGTDYTNYGVTEVSIPYDGADGTIKLAPYSAVVFSRSPPPSRDGDGDAMLDAWELTYSLCPTNAADADEDPDGDDLTNVREFELGTDPQVFNALSDYDTMSLAGTINNWDLYQTPMSLTSHYHWAAVRVANTSNLQFKFAADHTWDTCWGDADQSDLDLPFSGYGDPGALETPVAATNGLASNVLFYVFVETNRAYHVEVLPATDHDDDGMNDAWEVFYDFDTNDPGDAAGDPDDDDLSNVQEFRNGSHPRVATAKRHDYDTISVAGTFNAWRPSRSPMKLYEDYGWQNILYLEAQSNVAFKFVGNGSWSWNWGDSNQLSTTLPLNENGDWFGGNIQVNGAMNGVYHFRFNQQSVLYRVDELPPKDADSDGLHDDWEDLHGLNTNDASDATGDPDHDGLTNEQEFEYGTDPHVADEMLANYGAMAVAGTFNGWSVTAAPMDLVDLFTWEGLIDLTTTGPAVFKFAANGSWDANWGDVDAATDAVPLVGVADWYGPNVTCLVERAGDYLFSFNDRTRQYSVDFVPRSSYGTLTVPGSFNGWDPTAYPMQLIDNYTWELQATFSQVSNASFKFVGDTDWDTNWGETNQAATTLPLFGTGDSFGDNIGLTEPLSGKYRFRFDDSTAAFSLVALSRTDTDGDGMPDDWEVRHGLNPTNAADAALHGDSDNVSNLDEYRADTDPTNSDSLLLIEDCAVAPDGTVVIGWQGGRACWQYLLRAPPGAADGWETVATNGPPTADRVALTNTTSATSAWYSVRVSRLPPD